MIDDLWYKNAVIDPRYGTLGDFVEFARGCDAHGIRLVIDLVVNHTSNEHPWFKSARSDPASPYRDWYVWSQREPKNDRQGMAFPLQTRQCGTAAPR